MNKKIKNQLFLEKRLIFQERVKTAPQLSEGLDLSYEELENAFYSDALENMEKVLDLGRKFNFSEIDLLDLINTQRNESLDFGNAHKKTYGGVKNVASYFNPFAYRSIRDLPPKDLRWKIFQKTISTNPDFLKKYLKNKIDSTLPSELNNIKNYQPRFFNLKQKSIVNPEIIELEKAIKKVKIASFIDQRSSTFERDLKIAKQNGWEIKKIPGSLGLVEITVKINDKLSGKLVGKIENGFFKTQLKGIKNEITISIKQKSKDYIISQRIPSRDFSADHKIDVNFLGEIVLIKQDQQILHQDDFKKENWLTLKQKWSEISQQEKAFFLIFSLANLNQDNQISTDNLYTKGKSFFKIFSWNKRPIFNLPFTSKQITERNISQGVSLDTRSLFHFGKDDKLQLTQTGKGLQFGFTENKIFNTLVNLLQSKDPANDQKKFDTLLKILEIDDFKNKNFLTQNPQNFKQKINQLRKKLIQEITSQDHPLQSYAQKLEQKLEKKDNNEILEIDTLIIEIKEINLNEISSDNSLQKTKTNLSNWLFNNSDQQVLKQISLIDFNNLLALITEKLSRENTSKAAIFFSSKEELVKRFAMVKNIVEKVDQTEIDLKKAFLENDLDTLYFQGKSPFSDQELAAMAIKNLIKNNQGFSLKAGMLYDVQRNINVHNENTYYYQEVANISLKQPNIKPGDKIIQDTQITIFYDNQGNILDVVYNDPQNINADDIEAKNWKKIDQKNIKNSKTETKNKKIHWSINYSEELFRKDLLNKKIGQDHAISSNASVGIGNDGLFAGINTGVQGQFGSERNNIHYNASLNAFSHSASLIPTSPSTSFDLGVGTTFDQFGLPIDLSFNRTQYLNTPIAINSLTLSFLFSSQKKLAKSIAKLLNKNFDRYKMEKALVSKNEQDLRQAAALYLNTKNNSSLNSGNISNFQVSQAIKQYVRERGEFLINNFDQLHSWFLGGMQIGLHKADFTELSNFLEPIFFGTIGFQIDNVRPFIDAIANLQADFNKEKKIVSVTKDFEINDQDQKEKLNQLFNPLGIEAVHIENQKFSLQPLASSFENFEKFVFKIDDSLSDFLEVVKNKNGKLIIEMKNENFSLHLKGHSHIRAFNKLSKVDEENTICLSAINFADQSQIASKKTHIISQVSTHGSQIAESHSLLTGYSQKEVSQKLAENKTLNDVKYQLFIKKVKTVSRQGLDINDLFQEEKYKFFAEINNNNQKAIKNYKALAQKISKAFKKYSKTNIKKTDQVYKWMESFRQNPDIEKSNNPFLKILGNNTFTFTKDNQSQTMNLNKLWEQMSFKEKYGILMRVTSDYFSEASGKVPNKGREIDYLQKALNPTLITMFKNNSYFKDNEAFAAKLHKAWSYKLNSTFNDRKTEVKGTEYANYNFVMDGSSKEQENRDQREHFPVGGKINTIDTFEFANWTEAENLNLTNTEKQTLWLRLISPSRVFALAKSRFNQLMEKEELKNSFYEFKLLDQEAIFKNFCDQVLFADKNKQEKATFNIATIVKKSDDSVVLNNHVNMTINLPSPKDRVALGFFAKFDDKIACDNPTIVFAPLEEKSINISLPSEINYANQYSSGFSTASTSSSADQIAANTYPGITSNSIGFTFAFQKTENYQESGNDIHILAKNARQVQLKEKRSLPLSWGEKIKKSLKNYNLPSTLQKVVTDHFAGKPIRSYQYGRLIRGLARDPEMEEEKKYFENILKNKRK